MKRYSLTKAEQETIILWDNELDTAEIFTYDRKLSAKLKDLAKRYPEEIILKEKGQQRAVSYQVPKKCVSVRAPYNKKRREQQSQAVLKRSRGGLFAGKEETNGTENS